MVVITSHSVFGKSIVTLANGLVHGLEARCNFRRYRGLESQVSEVPC